jgi:thiol-disulfide isomerase/thioredoxin
MAIFEIQEKELLNRLTIEHEKEAIFFYTGLCGTCRLGERMLEIIDTMNNHIPIHKVNINYAPKLRDSWRIASVPCLVILQNGKPEQYVYAMRSVDYLYEILKV